MSVFSRLLNHIPNTKTVITWYRRSEGLADDAKIYVFGDGHALRVLRNNAYRVNRGLSKDERLVLLDVDKVDARLRAYAEEELGTADLVYVADIAPAPQDADLITICAVLASAYNEEPALKAEKVEEAPIMVAHAPVVPKAEPKHEEPKPAPKPRAKAKPRTKVKTRAKSKPMAEPKSVTVAEFKAVPTEVAEPEAKVEKVIEFEPIAEPVAKIETTENNDVILPQPEPVAAPVANSRPAARKTSEKGLFDDFLFEYAKVCREGGEMVISRSPWSNEMVCSKSVGDIEGVYQIGLLIIAFAFGLCVWSLIHFDVIIDFSTLMGVLGAVIVVWSSFMLWFNHRIKKIKKTFNH